MFIVSSVLNICFVNYTYCCYITFSGKVSDKKVVCYMTSWAFYRRGEGKFVPEQIDTRLCSHVVYAYASLSPDELIAKEFDPWTDSTNSKLFITISKIYSHQSKDANCLSFCSSVVLQICMRE